VAAVESRRISGAFDDLDGPVTQFGEGVTQVGAVIDAVSEQMAQPGKQLVDGLDNQHCPIAILDIGEVHLGTDQQTTSISHNMTLAAFDLLGRIVATRPAAFGRLDRLTVDHSRIGPAQAHGFGGGFGGGGFHGGGFGGHGFYGGYGRGFYGGYGRGFYGGHGRGFYGGYGGFYPGYYGYGYSPYCYYCY
jgi:hypothetical protein